MASKIRMCNEIRAMTISLGLPTFFITVNPADCFNPIVKVVKGESIDIDKMTADDIPTYWAQLCIIAKNPFVGAKFFHHFIDTFVDKVLGRDRKDRLGVLGQYKTHYGTVEAQGRGSLHCHLLYG